jgi:NAD(P)-dependent dehydrogenase (short-subunit alcohol dehydrogenase family)
MMKTPSFSFDGRRALVTGASRGIGQAISVALAQAGAAVIIAARSVSRLEETRALITAEGGQALIQTLDVADTDSIARCFAALGGPLDILVNNAGMEEVRPSLDVDPPLWDRIMDVNLRGAFFCAQAAAAEMTSQSDGRRGGVILNLCSLTSVVGVPTAVAYGASKTGLVGMTRALAAEWAPLGIRVNGIGPGYFQTALTEPFYADPAWRDAMLAKIPLGRFGRMEDLMGAAVFLCSDAAAYITGQVLYIDGGTLAAL